VQSNIIEIKKLVPRVLCEKVIAYFNNYSEATVTGGYSGERLKSTRNCEQHDIVTDQTTFGKRLITQRLVSYIHAARKIYKEKFPYMDAEEVSELQILKYQSNQYNVGYTYHTDFSRHTPTRVLSCSISLNTDYEGGLFEFDLNGQKTKYCQNIGDCIMFPSNFMYPHTVLPVTKGTRYAIISWIK
jgi:predicted 2-oxoglutarate/Fe(II)-dependent dioxygenase YbiX